MSRVSGSSTLSTRARAWTPSARTVNAACLSVLVLNTVIVVTGGAVRLTGSGLGCPTWPNCTADSLFTTPAMGVHGVIEFGNRLLTTPLTLAMVWALVAVVRQRPRRTDLTWLAWAQLGGAGFQAALGGVVVWTGLSPLTVAAHFLVSMALIAGATTLWVRQRQDGREHPPYRRELRGLATALVVVTALVLLLGTVVTGSGPHSGDVDVSHRLPFAPAAVTQLHSDAVLLLVGLSVALRLTLGAFGADRRLVRLANWLLVVEAAQGVLGYVQHLTGLPALLVGAHMLGSCLTWIAVLRVRLAVGDGRSGPAAADNA